MKNYRLNLMLVEMLIYQQLSIINYIRFICELIKNSYFICRCSILFQLIISGLQLKRQTAQKITCFLSKIEDLTFLTLVCLQTEGKRGNRPFSPCNLRFAKIRHISDYFADYGCKIIDEFTSILACYCSQKKKSASIVLLWRSPLFSSLFQLYFNVRIYEYGDKVKSFFFWQVKRVFNVMM